MRHGFDGNSIAINHSSDYLDRPRINKLFEIAMNYPLVTIYAGSGYGKTRALFSFLKDYDAHTSWLQLSERDNIPSRYWENYAHMVSLSFPEAAERILQIGFPETEEALMQFSAMIREASTLPYKQVTVFDDFHLLHNPTVINLFERIVSDIPPNVTMVLISRSTPKLNLIGMMMQERIFTIREDILCFSEDEIVEYFKQLALPATRSDIRDVYDDTLGWAFAINLIGRSLKKGMKYERHALEVMKSNIFKLIETELSRTVSKQLWRFLLRISLIDHLSADLIKSMAVSDALIAELERLNAYVIYDFHLDAYVIHHLFLDYLRQNQSALTEEEKFETYRVAGSWCEKNHYQTDALSYYEKACDYDTIIRIANSFGIQIPLDMVRYTLKILERTPEHATINNPQFPAVYLKMVIKLGLIGEASGIAKKYAADFESRPESPEKNRALSGIYEAWGLLRLIMSTDTDVYDFDEYFEKQWVYYEKNPFITPHSAINQSVGAWALPVGTNRAGAPEEYIESLSRSIQHISRSQSGNFHGLDDLARGELHFFRRELGDADQYLKQALGKAQKYDQYDIQNRCLLYLMRISFSRGDFTDVEKLHQSLKELLEEADYALRYTTYDIASGFYYLMLGQPEQVPEWLKGDFEIYSHPMYTENYINFIKAHYHYQTRQFSALFAFIDNEWNRQTVLLGKIELKVLEALSLYQIKRRHEAIAALTEAFNLAEPNGFVSAFIQHSKDMRTLTAAALKDEECPIPKLWLENINRKSSAYAKRQTHMISMYKTAHNIEDFITLTKRESEILRDLSHGLSRTEIAASQNISVNTAKMVINSIYDKLSANSLADAIRIAVDRRIV